MSNDQVKILIVEDDIDLQDAYSMILSSQGFNVKTANDGLDALNALHGFIPTIILLDYFMPRMNGKNFLENFDQTRFPSTKVIVASNISDKALLDELVSLGASKYVLKADLSPNELVKLVEESAQV